MEQIRTLIVDDEPLARQHLRVLLPMIRDFGDRRVRQWP